MNETLVFRWYEQYKNGIFRYALSILKDVQLAEDVLQDTFLRLLSGRGFPDPGKERAWLYTVARNLCFDYLRKHRKERPEDEDIYHEGRYAYIDLISTLSTQEKEIVTLRIVGDLTHKEIGAVLGISSRAAQKRYERAIARLRKEYQNGE